MAVTMDRILKGVMKYRQILKEEMVKQMIDVKNHPTPEAVFFTCVDSRMLPSRFTQTNPGDMIIVRNAGNMVPNAQHFQNEFTTSEPGALELGCVINDIKHIIVCGHSNCKAMTLLHKFQNSEFASKDNRRKSPLKSWVYNHGLRSLEKFQEFQASDFGISLMFRAETPFEAYIDPENKFSAEDKLSQINTLQQLRNVDSYEFLQKRKNRHELHIHALWYDLSTGEINFFSRTAKRFLPIDDENFKALMNEVQRLP